MNNYTNYFQRTESNLETFMKLSNAFQDNPYQKKELGAQLQLAPGAISTKRIGKRNPGVMPKDAKKYRQMTCFDYDDDL